MIVEVTESLHSPYAWTSQPTRCFRVPQQHAGLELEWARHLYWEVETFIRLLSGYFAGALLGAFLTLSVYPLDGSIVILSWPFAGGIGWFSGWIAGRLKVCVAVTSMITGAAMPIVIGAYVPLHQYFALYGGPYVIYALLGGIASSLRHDEQDTDLDEAP